MMLPLAGVFARLGATGLQGNLPFSLAGGVERIERLEMIAGPTGRPSWSDEAKARIVLESHGPGARVVDVARRHGVAAQQVTTWRREARQGVGASLTIDAPAPSPQPNLGPSVSRVPITPALICWRPFRWLVWQRLRALALSAVRSPRLSRM